MIELERLSKQYDGLTAVDEVSLRVEPGELVVLLGGSGCGKTTTLKMINRLIEPSQGTVRIDGRDVGTLAPHELRRQIGYVFQRIGLFPHMTVAENIGITPRLLGWEPERIAARADELLDLVELDPVTMRDRRPEALSGGQQQRVGVARALAASPQVLLLDEPFGALDPLTRDRLQQSLQDIRRRLGLTSIFVTHDMVEALILGDRIVVMDAGRFVQVGTPGELLRAPGTDLVRQLMETPKRQTAAVEALLGRAQRGQEP